MNDSGYRRRGQAGLLALARHELVAAAKSPRQIPSFDFARPTLADAPDPVRSSVRAFLVGATPPRERLARMAAERDEAVARIFFRRPHRLSPGRQARFSERDILVTRSRTPAWTALFSRLSGLVTDPGGPLAHGSIVAREVGIPAVMATGTATGCIRSGQTITVLGSEGKVLLG